MVRHNNQRSVFLAFVLATLIAVSRASGQELPVALQAGNLPPNTAAMSPSSVEIEVGTLGGNKGLADWVSNEISLFEKSGQGVTVRTVALDGLERDIYPIETLPQLAENVFVIRSEMGYEPWYLAKKRLIVPINRFLPDPELSTSDFYDALWEPITLEGQLWGVPLCSRPDVLIFNRLIFREEGIESPPQSWDDFVSYARRLTKDRDGDGQIDQWGVRIDSSEFIIAYPLISMIFQKGGQVIRNGRYSLEDPVCEEAYNFWKEFVNSSGACKIDGRDFSEAVRDNHYAMQIVHTRNVQWAQRRSDLQLAYLPTWGKKVSFSETNLYWAIRQSTPEKEKASWAFVKWMSRRDVSLPTQSIFRGWPCRKDFVEREDFRNLARKGPMDFDVLFRAQEFSADLGEQTVMHRLQAFDGFSKALQRGVLANQEFASVAGPAVREANAICERLSVEDADAIYK